MSLPRLTTSVIIGNEGFVSSSGAFPPLLGSRSSDRHSHFPITVSQVVQDIATKIEVDIDPPRINTPQPLYLSSTKRRARREEVPTSPTVPRCLNDYFQVNANAEKRQTASGHAEFFGLNRVNRSIIALMIHHYRGEKYILLRKNRSGRWELPKMREVREDLLYRTLTITYLHHPLNTNDAWLEVQLILIDECPSSIVVAPHWFLLASLPTLTNLEPFDGNLIQSYLFK